MHKNLFCHAPTAPTNTAVTAGHTTTGSRTYVCTCIDYAKKKHTCFAAKMLRNTVGVAALSKLFRAALNSGIEAVQLHGEWPKMTVRGFLVMLLRPATSSRGAGVREQRVEYPLWVLNVRCEGARLKRMFNGSFHHSASHRVVL